ncbi:hypothetical protein I4F81_003013 [Pyropia yezoensis]|uniref:Uncharacterized protein n=1 Tax=Pyropia yezoensis TaxID=2788 RepID=A0ACC3BRV2_PYRYE|nr:hypothetical protein I4F81_003013 [Neopyropia yezoensis]
MHRRGARSFSHRVASLGRAGVARGGKALEVAQPDAIGRYDSEALILFLERLAPKHPQRSILCHQLQRQKEEGCDRLARAHRKGPHLWVRTRVTTVHEVVGPVFEAGLER